MDRSGSRQSGRRSLRIASTPITGELLRVPLKPGDRVAARAILLGRVRPAEPGPLDARTLAEATTNVAAREAQLGAVGSKAREALAEQALAEREFARVSALIGRGFVSEASVDRARMARNRARAASAQARRRRRAIPASAFSPPA